VFEKFGNDDTELVEELRLVFGKLGYDEPEPPLELAKL